MPKKPIGPNVKKSIWNTLAAKVSLLLAGVAALAALFGNVESIKRAITPEPELAPKVRVQYFHVGGHGISLALLGILDPKLQRHLGGRPVVWQNEVYRDVEDLHNKFALKVPSDLELVSWEYDGEELGSIPPSVKVIRFAQHRAVELDAEQLIELTLLGDPVGSSEWSVAWVKNQPGAELAEALRDGAVSIDNLVFSKRLECEQAVSLLESIGDIGGEFYRDAISNGCRNFTVDVLAQYHEQGCGGEGWKVHVQVPGILLNMAVIQNITDKPIRIEKMGGELTQIKGIGNSPHHADEMKDARIGDGTLLAEDRLIVPLGLRFDYNFIEQPDIETPDVFDRTESGFYTVMHAANSHESLALTVESAQEQPSDEDEVQFIQKTVATINVDQLKTRYGFTPNQMNKDPLHVGRVLRLDSLVVDGLKEPVHQLDLGGLFVSETYSGGSCPYLYAGKDESSLRQLGKILVHRNSSAKRGRDSKFVSSWPELLVVAERDPETTYLFGVSVTCETAGGELLVRYPEASTSPLFREPLLLRRGEKQAFKFPPPTASQCSTVFITLDGYYVPDSATVVSSRVEVRSRTLTAE